MAEASNSCQLVEFEGAGHGFFNHGRHGNEAFDRTLALATDFILDAAPGKSMDEKSSRGR